MRKTLTLLTILNLFLVVLSLRPSSLDWAPLLIVVSIAINVLIFLVLKNPKVEAP